MELGDDCSCDNPAAERRRVRSGGECNGGVDTRRRRLQRRRRARRRRLQVLSGGRSDAGTADRRDDRGFVAVFVRSGGENGVQFAAAASAVAAAIPGGGDCSGGGECGGGDFRSSSLPLPFRGERGGENLDRGSLFLTLSCHGDVPST